MALTYALTKVIKNVLVGPNLKRSGSNFQIPGGTNTLVLFPYRKDNTTWAGVNVGGTTPKVVYYHDLDETAGTITFSPTNATTLAEAFATLPTIKSQIKTAFGLDAKIVVSSPLVEIKPPEYISHQVREVREVSFLSRFANLADFA